MGLIFSTSKEKSFYVPRIEGYIKDEIDYMRWRMEGHDGMESFDKWYEYHHNPDRGWQREGPTCEELEAGAQFKWWKSDRKKLLELPDDELDEMNMKIRIENKIVWKKEQERDQLIKFHKIEKIRKWYTPFITIFSTDFTIEDWKSVPLKPLFPGLRILDEFYRIESPSGPVYYGDDDSVRLKPKSFELREEFEERMERSVAICKTEKFNIDQIRRRGRHKRYKEKNELRWKKICEIMDIKVEKRRKLLVFVFEEIGLS